jgi:hypothetical protein
MKKGGDIGEAVAQPSIYRRKEKKARRLATTSVVALSSPAVSTKSAWQYVKAALCGADAVT